MMEFENQREAEEDEEEMEEEMEEEEEEDDATLHPANYESSLPNSSSRPFKMPAHTEGGSAAAANNEARSPSPPPLPLSLSFPAGKKPPARYRECLKNHAVGLGGHAVDGCCEFMPAGPEGSLDALKCAACNCHRNFHRKEAVDPTTAIQQQQQQQNHHPIQTPIAYFPHPHPQHQHQHHHHHPIFQFYPYGRASPGGYPHPHPQQRPLALPSTSGGGSRGGGEVEEAEMISEPMSAMGLGSSSSGKKRFRTKFTAEQKEKMLELAEKVGWRLQKQDEPLIRQFCDETGVKRHVLKVWMHNNKHTLGKRNPSI